MNETESNQFNELLHYIETFYPTLKYLRLNIIGIKNNDNSYDAIGVKAEFLHEANPESEIILDIPELVIYHSVKSIDIEEIKNFVKDINNGMILIDNLSFDLKHFNDFSGILLKGHKDYISDFYYRTKWPYYLFEGVANDKRIKDFLNEEDLNKDLNRQGYENLIEVSKEFLDCNIGYDWPFRFYLIIPIKILAEFEIVNRRLIFNLECHRSIKIDELEIATKIEAESRQRLKIKFNPDDKISEKKDIFYYKKIEHIQAERIEFIKIWVSYQNEQIDQFSISYLKDGKKIDEINKKLKKLEKIIEDLKNQLKEATDENEIYEIKWKLKDSYNLAKDKYHLLEVWTKKTQDENYFKCLYNEILYYERCLKMLKNKHGTERIDYRHYLIVAYLENIYFPDNEYPQKFNEFQGSKSFRDIRIEMIVNNIQNAQKNLKLLIEHHKKNVDYKSLFIYYELLGDLEIHVFCYFQEFESISVRESLLNAFLYYRISIWHKTQLERSDPKTYFDGLHGWESHSIFHDFYRKLRVSSITDVRDKEKRLQLKYPLTPDEHTELNNLLMREINGQ